MAHTLTITAQRNPYRLLVFLAAPLALAVVGLGAWVRLNDAGLACPDWPGCYGALVGVPDHAADVSRAWLEMAHRYLAGTLGLLVLAITILAWRSPSPSQAVQASNRAWPETFLLALITFQALLGMLTVTKLLAPVVVTAHLLGGMLTWTLLCVLAWWESGYAPQNSLNKSSNAKLKLIGWAALITTFVQLALGAWVSSHYAGLACPDFPMCGAPLEGNAMIQWQHRLGGVAVFLVVGFYAHKLAKAGAVQRRFARLIAIFLITQLSLGVAAVLVHLPPLLALAHNLGAALLIATIALSLMEKNK